MFDDKYVNTGSVWVSSGDCFFVKASMYVRSEFAKKVLSGSATIASK